MKHLIRVAVLMPVCAIALSGCASATWLPSFLQKDPPPQQAAIVPDPPEIVHTVQVVQPLPLPGQLQPKPRRGAHVARPPKSRVEAANLAVLQEPTTDGYINAIQVYPYSEGALYRLYATPQEVSDIALQPGESLTAIPPATRRAGLLAIPPAAPVPASRSTSSQSRSRPIFGPISSSPPIVGAITSSSKAPTGPIWRQSPGPIRRMVW